MKASFGAALAGLAAITQAYTISETQHLDNAIQALSVARRALPDSPNGYTPSAVDCPSDGVTVRNAQTLSQEEREWTERRRNNTVSPMRDLLTRILSGFDAGSYIDEHQNNASALPNIGIAFSGGGYRALMNGAGALRAFDSRSSNSTNAGQLGGLLQASTYIAGLSGGSWLLGSIYVNNFTTVEASQNDPDGSLWEFGNSIFEGPARGGVQVLDTAQYYSSIISDVNGKRDAGFDASITDIWGRALSYQLVNASRGGDAYTWSSIADTDGFRNAEMPLPFVIADGRAPGETIISLNSTVYEFSPFEMGSWDSSLFGFIPTQYLGTNMSNGQVRDGSQCIVGFDNAGFVMGTSSSLFNQILLQANDTELPSTVKALINTVFGGLSESDNDIADYTPNPFFGYNPATNYNADSERLTLVDGGEDLQNIPLYSLIQPNRQVDVIFAVDSSADTSNWPNATALVATYERSQNAIANGTGFPYIPDVNTIVNLGLNNRPTFFGCDSSNVTNADTDPAVPLVVYIPNAPYTANSNISTFQMDTNNTQRDAIIINGYNVATMGNGTVESDWSTCVGCAILQRSMERTNTAIPDACTACFTKYCWDGTLNSTTPTPYVPESKLDLAQIANAGWSLKTGAQSTLATVVAGIVILAISS